MASSELKVKVSLDGATGTSSGLDALRKRFSEVGTQARAASAKIMSVSRALASVATRGVATGIAAVSTALKGLTVAAGLAGAAATLAFKNAIGYGAQMHKMANALGVDAGQVDLLTQAFRENGLGMETLQTALPFMIRSISSGSKAFEKIGLAADDLKGKSVVDQFRMIGEAIRNTTSQEDKVSALMEIFSRSGAQLSQLFNNPTALEDAAKTLGGEVELMARQAATFERVSTLVSNIGVKVRTLFSGIAGGLVEPLRNVLETLNGYDFTAWGEKIGNAIGQPLTAAIQAFKEGRLAEYLQSGLLLACSKFGDAFRSVLLNGEMFSALGQAMLAAGKLAGEGFSAAIRSAVGVDTFDKWSDRINGAARFVGEKIGGGAYALTHGGETENSGDMWARIQRELAREREHGNASTAGKDLADALQNVGSAAKSWKFSTSEQTRALGDEYKRLTDEFLSRAPNMAVEPAGNNAGGNGSAASSPEEAASPLTAAMAKAPERSNYFHVGGYMSESEAAAAKSHTSPTYTFQKKTSDNTTTMAKTLTAMNSTLTSIASYQRTSTTSSAAVYS